MKFFVLLYSLKNNFLSEHTVIKRKWYGHFRRAAEYFSHFLQRYGLFLTEVTPKLWTLFRWRSNEVASEQSNLNHDGWKLRFIPFCLLTTDSTIEASIDEWLEHCCIEIESGQLKFKLSGLFKLWNLNKNNSLKLGFYFFWKIISQQRKKKQLLCFTITQIKIKF